MDYTKYIDMFHKRLSELRLQKGVSARDMSLSLGQSESYINKIENKRTLPSMSGFFFICEYLGIEPHDFFATEIDAPQKTAQLIKALGKLKPHQVDHLMQIIYDITDSK